MAYIATNKQRDIFVDTIQQKLLGPGGDVFGFPDEEELIAVDPLKLYYSGILFPAAFAERVEETEEPELDADGAAPTPPDVVDDEKPASEEEEHDPSARLQSFYPRNFGILFSVNSDCEEFKVKLSYAKYEVYRGMEMILSQEEHNHLEILLDEIDTDKKLYLTREDLKSTVTFAPTLHTEEEKSSFLHELKGKFWGKARDNGHFLYSNEYLKSKFFKFFFKRDKFKRSPFFLELELPILDGKQQISPEEPNLQYHIKSINKGDKKFVKILISNESDGKGRASDNCFFQVDLRVETDKMIPYENRFANSIDA